MFSPDHEASARELARVTKPGGRIALANWQPGPGVQDLFKLMAPYQPSPPPSSPFDWGDEAKVTELIGDDFDLSFETRTNTVNYESGEAFWQHCRRTTGPRARSTSRWATAARRCGRDGSSSSAPRPFARPAVPARHRGSPLNSLTDESLVGEVTTLLQELIRLDTTNPPGNETLAAELLRDYLEAAGVECRLYARVPRRANLVARSRAAEAARRSRCSRTPTSCSRIPRNGNAIRSAASSSATRSGAAARST